MCIINATFKNQGHSLGDTAQKMKFPIEDFFGKCDQIHRKLYTGHIH